MSSRNRILHHATTTTWSSARNAAYSKAARMSSGSMYGYDFTMAWVSSPAARRPRSLDTGKRNPRMQGLPKHINGSIVIRFSSIYLYYSPHDASGKALYERRGRRSSCTRVRSPLFPRLSAAIHDPLSALLPHFPLSTRHFPLMKLSTFSSVLSTSTCRPSYVHSVKQLTDGQTSKVACPAY